MRRKIKIGQEVAVIRFDFKTYKQSMEKGKVVAICEPIPNIQNEERLALVFKNGQIDDFDTSRIFTKWDENFIKKEEE